MPYLSTNVRIGKSKFRPPVDSKQGNVLTNPTMDLKDAPQLLNPNQALKITNYTPTTDYGLSKRSGLIQLLNDAANTAPTMLEWYTPDIVFYTFGTTLKAYQISTGVTTIIKSNFTSSAPFSGARYGDYFFLCNGGDPIGRVSRTLAYNTQTSAFTVGKTLTGQTSGATATILEDSGTALTLGSVNGVFQNGEIIKDNNGTPGSATLGGTLTYTFTSISGAPFAKVLKAIGGRLFAGNLSTDSTAVAYSNIDTGANPPFTNWTVPLTPLAADPGLVRFGNAGSVQAIDSLGQNIVVLATNGKWAFQITSITVNNQLVKNDDFILQRLDLGGSRASLSTPKGLFYVNSAGIWQLTALGQPNVPFSDQEQDPAILLGSTYFNNIDLTNSDFTFDGKNNILYLTCAQDSSVNNYVIAYNIQNGTFADIKGWNINRWMKIGQQIYGASALNGKIWTCFKGNDDDGKEIWTHYRQEIRTGDLETRQMLVGEYLDALVSPSTNLLFALDIVDVFGTLIPNKLKLNFKPKYVGGSGDGYGLASWGQMAIGGDDDSGSPAEYFDGARKYIRNYQRIILDISEHSKVPHTLVWFKLLTRVKAEIRRRGMTVLS